jgi:PAS domain-containing protein
MAVQVDRSSQPAPELRMLPDAISVLAWANDPNGAMEFVNQRWGKYTGLSPEES